MTKHARAFDLPGWPCPPRVRDIPNHEESWGLIYVVSVNGELVQDDLGLLWVDGAATPRFAMPREEIGSPGAIACWTEDGIGVWVHPKSLKSIGSLSRTEMEHDRWIPVAVALAEPPEFVKGAQ